MATLHPVKRFRYSGLAPVATASLDVEAIVPTCNSQFAKRQSGRIFFELAELYIRTHKESMKLVWL